MSNQNDNRFSPPEPPGPNGPVEQAGQQPPHGPPQGAPGWGAPSQPPGWGAPSQPPAYNQPPAYDQGAPGWGTPNQPPNYNMGGPAAPQWGPQGGARPPVIHFRPLTLGDLIEGTFAAVRSNPKVMFTLSLVVMVTIGVINGIFVASFAGVSFDDAWLDTLATDPEVAFGLESFAAPVAQQTAQFVTTMIAAAASLFITGLLVLTVTNATIGKKLDISQTWEQLKPHIWRLIGTALLVYLIIFVATLVLLMLPIGIGVSLIMSDFEGAGVVLLVIMIFVAIGALTWLSIRLYFATMVVVVEGSTPIDAIRRAWALSKNAFWRVLGRLLLIGIIVGIITSLFGALLSAIVLLGAGFTSVWITAFLLTVISSVIAGLTLPVTASFSALMYVDERIRKDNLAPALQQALDESRMQPPGMQPGQQPGW